MVTITILIVYATAVRNITKSQKFVSGEQSPA